MTALPVTNLEADCAERDPGDEHQDPAGNQGTARTHSPQLVGSIPAPASTIDGDQARVTAAYSGDKVMVFFTDNSGHRSVVMLSHIAAEPLIDDLVAAQACAEAHAKLRVARPRESQAKDSSSSLKPVLFEKVENGLVAPVDAEFMEAYLGWPCSGGWLSIRKNWRVTDGQQCAAWSTRQAAIAHTNGEA